MLVFDRRGAPWLIAECKRPDVPIGDFAAWQAARYNMEWAAPYLLLTNGRETRLFFRPSPDEAYLPLDDIPAYDAV